VTTLQQQARALGDPTRHDVFRYVADAEDPVGVAELTAHFGLNHNAIRQHLAKLVDAELVVETQVQTGGRGRPRLAYAVDPSAESRWGVTGPYERLSLLLAEMISTGDSAEEVGRRAGQRFRVGSSSVAESVADITAAMASQGFDPEVRPRKDGTEIVLRSCPFTSTVLFDPDIVCQLHLGIAEGLADANDAISVDELIAKDPRRAGCRLRLQIDNGE
jgi:predicted ArsR family transcriptional regulator